MQNIIRKKGVAPIIAVVVLVGMSIIALTLVGTYVFNLVAFSETQLAPLGDCISYKSHLGTINYQNGNLNVEIVRSLSDKEIRSFKLIIGSDSYTCGDNCDNCNIPEMGSSHTYIYPFSSMPKEVTLFANGNCNLGTSQVKEISS
jgi:hypothetical protein|tara:strand:+ start:187 stop:621 length:435 start_codon:yes stop_codon:yes gene_type:complete